MACADDGAEVDCCLHEAFPAVHHYAPNCHFGGLFCGAPAGMVPLAVERTSSWLVKVFGSRVGLDFKNFSRERNHQKSHLSISLCTTRVANPFFSSARFIHSAIITERCFPPVHPNAIVR